MKSRPLEQLAEACGREFKNLAKARQETEKKVEQRRTRIDKLNRCEDTSVVLMGSWGRSEVTSGSDDDYMILVNGAWRPEHEIDPSIDDVAQLLNQKPGREGAFGEIAFSDYLEKRIGLQEDDNNNLTRRMLLLLESRPILGDENHRVAQEKILDCYLRDARKPNSPPRLLLNDVVRYWRTICVDFAGKQRKRRGEGWGIRNAKLRTSRKLLFASGLLPILECPSDSHEGMRSFLLDRLRMPSTDRLARSFLDAGVPDVGGRTLGAYDEFIGRLDEASFRAALESVPREDGDRSDEFLEARRLGRAIQSGLLGLLFETDLLRSLVREFAIF
jgi:hypothetical protein